MISKSLRRVEPTETQITQGIVRWANLTKLPNCDLTVGDFLVGIPNAGKRKVKELINGKSFCVEGKRLKAEGMKKGVSDLFLPFAYFSLGCNEAFAGLWIEVKTKTGKLSLHQKKWIELMEEKRGALSIRYRAKVVRSVDEGRQAIKEYLGMK